MEKEVMEGGSSHNVAVSELKTMQKQHDEKLSKIQELKGTKEALMNELEKKKNENPEKMKEFNELSEEYNSRRDQFMALLADKPHENNKK
ncbi:hypothetical protein BUALT_Bualt02G0180900 [Buddleja alternifolia]|uniref:Uncharacterized protein n=1 Tax=Buddleja alternifolia TaxID=168488 RepID=A0AAV6YBX0_9LAMI|nr:hypothetical protein BUALT_Bualt02G0180900 [Buddleja alternifolia]